MSVKRRTAMRGFRVIRMIGMLSVYAELLQCGYLNNGFFVILLNIICSIWSALALPYTIPGAPRRDKHR
jgi:hypothetical protein